MKIISFFYFSKGHRITFPWKRNWKSWNSWHIWNNKYSLGCNILLDFKVKSILLTYRLLPFVVYNWLLIPQKKFVCTISFLYGMKIFIPNKNYHGLLCKKEHGILNFKVNMERPTNLFKFCYFTDIVIQNWWSFQPYLTCWFPIFSNIVWSSVKILDVSIPKSNVTIDEKNGLTVSCANAELKIKSNWKFREKSWWVQHVHIICDHLNFKIKIFYIWPLCSR